MARKKQLATADRPVPAVSGSDLPTSYPELLEAVKHRISQSQIRAALSVNRELIQLYWEIGHLIVERQEREGWGKSVIERLAADIQASFPGIQGFSTTNIRRMRAFYLGYTKELTNLPQPVRDLPPPILPQPVGELDGVHLPEPVAEIPWGHNAVLIEKLKDPMERIWYARKTTEHGWSRAVLVHQIESDLYGRQGRAITNFEQTLPSPQSDLAQQLLKNPYTFDFLGLTDEVRERELENSLIDHIQRFLLELATTGSEPEIWRCSPSPATSDRLTSNRCRATLKTGAIPNTPTLRMRSNNKCHCTFLRTSLRGTASPTTTAAKPRETRRPCRS